MASPPEIPLPKPPGNLRWLRVVQGSALVSLALILGLLFSLEFSDGILTVLLIWALFSPLWLPYLWIVVRLRGEKKKKGLALSVGIGTGAFLVALVVTSETIAALVFALTQAVLVTGAIKTYYTMRREARDGRTLAGGFGHGALYSLALFASLVVLGIPPFGSRRGGLIPANEALAVGSLREINTAADAYSSTYGNGYPPSFASLAAPSQGSPSCAAAALIDSVLASGRKSGYVFEYKPGRPVEKPAAGCPPGVVTYTATARPRRYGKTGKQSFFTDQSGVIRATDEDRPPTAQDPFLGSKQEKYPAIISVAFSPDGKMLATGGGDDLVRLWDLALGKELQRLPGHRDGVGAVAFSPDGRLLASGSADGTLRVWEIASAHEIRKFEGLGGGIGSAAFSPDGKKLVAAEELSLQVHVWEVATGRELRGPAGPAPSRTPFAVSPDGKMLASGDESSPLVLWNLRTLKEMRKFKLSADEVGVFATAFSPDGKTLAGGIHDGTVRLWDVATGRELQRLPSGDRGVGSVAFSPDGQHLVSRGDDGKVRLWEVSTGKEIWKQDDSLSSSDSIFSPDGRTLASGSRDGSIILREAESGTIRRRFGGLEQ